MEKKELKLIAHVYHTNGFMGRFPVKRLNLNKEYNDFRELTEENINELIEETQKFNGLDYFIVGSGFAGIIGTIQHTKKGLFDKEKTLPVIKLELNGEVIWKKSHLISVENNMIFINAEKEKTVSIIGSYKMEDFKGAGTIRENIICEIFYLYNEGYRYFTTRLFGEFDLLAAECVLFAKKAYPDIKLLCMLPYKEMPENYKDEDKNRFYQLMFRADEVIRNDKVFNEKDMDRIVQLLINNSSVVLGYDNTQKPDPEMFYTKVYAAHNGTLIHNIFYRTLPDVEEIQENDKLAFLSSEIAGTIAYRKLYEKYEEELKIYDTRWEVYIYNGKYQAEFNELYEYYQKLLSIRLALEKENILYTFDFIIKTIVNYFSKKEKFIDVREDYINDKCQEWKTIEEKIPTQIEAELYRYILLVLIRAVIENLQHDLIESGNKEYKEFLEKSNRL